MKKRHDRVLGFEKGLSLIEAFGQSKKPLTLTQAAEITGYSKASVRRSLLSLCDLGYAQQKDRYFQLTPRSLRLGSAYIASEPMANLGQSILKSMSERTQQSAYLAVLDSSEAVFISRSVDNRDVVPDLAVGSRLPAYCSATGRVLLSCFDETELECLLNGLARPALTPHTRTSVRDIVQEIDRVRTNGYSISDQEVVMGMRAIAVPVRSPRGELLAAMGLSIKNSRMKRARIIDTLLPELQVARAQLATSLSRMMM